MISTPFEEKFNLTAQRVQLVNKMKRKFFNSKVGEQEHVVPKSWIPDEEKTWLEAITVPWPLHNQVGVLTFELRSNILELLPLQSTSSTAGCDALEQ